jgi:hypothetical protein
MIENFSKPSSSILSLKQNFFDDNDVLLIKGKEINKVYSEQPKRTQCKNCNCKLDIEHFIKQGIPYGICSRCGHLNGLHEDTDDFCSALYTDDGGESYAKNYNSKDLKSYQERVNNIYVPKAEFLFNTLSQLEEIPSSLHYSDFGAGSGYFVSALLNIGISNILGYEVSDAQVNLGNSMIGNEYLKSHSLDDSIKIAETIDADVVSMIGVLEHLQNPFEILQALQKNKKVRYIYISVPLFSPCVFFEMVFPTIMQRQLSAGHTHLYTKSSLEWLSNEFDMEQVAAWWFGTDMVDLFRNIGVRLGQQNETKEMVNAWSEMFIPLIDVMQSEIDKKRLASEVHMLFKFTD